MTRLIVQFLLVACLFATSLGASAAAQPPGKVLRYVSLRAEKAYMREGPTYSHRVLWQYRHRGYPFAVIAEYDVWRRVRAVDGTTGWMSHAMLSDRRTVLQAELSAAERRLADLKAEYNNGNPERRGDERNYAKYQERVVDLKAQIDRQESDLQAIRRELGKLN